MPKDYLSMIADVDATVVDHEKDEIRRLSSAVTPAAVLGASRSASLTRDALRDAFIAAARRRGMKCTAAQACLCIDVSREAGIIVENCGLYLVRQ